MLVLLFSLFMTATVRAATCDDALANDRLAMERLLERGHLSDYRARWTTIYPAVPVVPIWRRPLARLERHRYVAALGPGPSNTVYRVDGPVVREVSNRKNQNARMRTADGDLAPGPGGWHWVDGAPAWYAHERLDPQRVLTHFAAPLHHLVDEVGIVTHAELAAAEFEHAAYDGRDLVYLQIHRDGRPRFLLLDVASRAVLSDFLGSGQPTDTVTIADRARLRPGGRAFLTVPSEGWAAAVAPRIPDVPLRTLFERFGPEFDAVFLEPDPPASEDLVRARVSAVTGDGEWRPYVALTLARRTLYFDPRSRRWLAEAEVRRLTGALNEDLPTPDSSSIHNDSATFGP